MILKLRKNKITLEPSTTPEPINAVQVSYIFELGTNHLIPKLTVNGIDTYEGYHLTVPMDYFTNILQLKVELLDPNRTIVRTYKGSCEFYKMCATGTKEYIDVYKRLAQVEKELKELKEQGEVI